MRSSPRGTFHYEVQTGDPAADVRAPRIMLPPSSPQFLLSPSHRVLSSAHQLSSVSLCYHGDDCCQLVMPTNEV